MKLLEQLDDAHKYSCELYEMKLKDDPTIDKKKALELSFEAGMIMSGLKFDGFGFLESSIKK
jgi:hypothetical protein